MSLVLAVVSPHPPIIVPEIGRDSISEVTATVEAMRSMGRQVGEESPETLIIMSPHSPAVGEAFLVRSAPVFSGSLGMFGAPGVRYELENDIELATAIVDASEARGLPVIGPSETGSAKAVGGSILDHGMLVPLYFMAPPESCRIVSLGISYLDLEGHYEFGRAVSEASEETGRRAVFVASGDLSHRLTPEAPAGYSPRGAEFDTLVKERLERCELAGFAEWDGGLVRAAGECGLRSIATMAGAFGARRAECRVLSYEGPFGVGYLVAVVRPGGGKDEDPGRPA